MKLFLLFITVPVLSFAQLTIQNNVLATAGQSQSNGTLRVDYNLGEVFTALLNNGARQYTQGFEQGQKSHVYTSNTDVESNLSVGEMGPDAFRIYPNPTFDYVTIESANYVDLNVELIDMTGRLVQVYALGVNTNKIDLRSFEDGTYQLIIKSNQELLIRVPIVKVN